MTRLLAYTVCYSLLVLISCNLAYSRAVDTQGGYCVLIRLYGGTCVLKCVAGRMDGGIALLQVKESDCD